MKILIILLLFFHSSFCQEITKFDTIFQLNGNKIACKVISISEFEVVFSYPNETLTNTITKKQLHEIHFASGRNQFFSERVTINGESDWEKVELTSLASDIIGLTKKGEVKGKSMGTAVANMTNVKKRAEEQIKREAAKLGAHIILIQSYNTSDSQPGLTYGKANINGVAYGYE